MKTCIFGAEGILGSAFWAMYQKEQGDTLGTSYKPNGSFFPFDLSFPEIDHLPLEGYTHAIIGASRTGLQQCEAFPQQTWEINVRGTLLLSKRLSERGIQPILFSSDQVFDGKKGEYTENDPINPLNEYGKQKAAIEKGISAATQGRYLLIRLGKVFSESPESFLHEIRDRLLQKKKIFAAKDQIFSPVFLKDVLNATRELQKKNCVGVYHLAGSEVISRYELARLIAQKIKAPLECIEEIELKDLGESFKRPCRTDLNLNKTREILKEVPKGVSFYIDRFFTHEV